MGAEIVVPRDVDFTCTTAGEPKMYDYFLVSPSLAAPFSNPRTLAAPWGTHAAVAIDMRKDFGKLPMGVLCPPRSFMHIDLEGLDSVVLADLWRVLPPNPARKRSGTAASEARSCLTARCLVTSFSVKRRLALKNPMAGR